MNVKQEKLQQVLVAVQGGARPSVPKSKPSRKTAPRLLGRGISTIRKVANAQVLEVATFLAAGALCLPRCDKSRRVRIFGKGLQCNSEGQGHDPFPSNTNPEMMNPTPLTF